MITFARISLLILIISANVIEAQRAVFLTGKIKELAPIARLTNGIALETEILTDPQKINYAIAEFLGIRSGDDLVKLKGVDVDGVVTGLGEIYLAVEKVPDMNVDVQAFKDSFEALDKMKGYSDVLNSTSGINVTEIGNDMQSASLSENVIRKIKHFEQAANHLRFITRNSIVNISDVNNGHLLPLKNAIIDIQSSLAIFQNFAQTFASLLHLYNTTTRLSGLANVSELLIANLGTFSTMGSNLTALKTGIDQLKPMIDKRKTIPQLTKTMQDTINIIKTSTGQTPQLKLTIGFSGDPNMIAELFQNLKTDYLKKVVSQGKDLKGIADSLKLLPKFQNKLQTVEQIWSAAVLDNWTSTDEAVQVFSGLALTNQNVPDTLTVSATLSAIQQCFSNFQRPSTMPNLDEVSTISTFASNLSQQILEWKTFFKEKEIDFGSLNTNLGDLYRFLNPIDNKPRNPERENAWNSIRNHTDNEKTVSVLNSIHTGLDRLLKNSPFPTITGPKPDGSVISGIVSSLNEVNLPSLLTCIEGQSNGLADITSMLRVGSSVQAIKTKKQSFNSLQTLFLEILKVKNEIIDLGSTMMSGRRRRRRGAASHKSLKNLGNAEDVSYNLGLGIQVLHKYAEIIEKQGSVMVAVDAVDPLASAVAAIPGSQTVWANRKSMGVMIDDLNKLETTAGNLKKDNLADLWKIFAEANLVPGVSINATLFDDPISKQLAQHPNPVIQAKSGDFKEIGSLDLNFVQHLVNLQKASQTLAPLQTFFDDYFDNRPGGPGAAGPGVEQDSSGDESFPIGTITISILFCSVIVGSTGAGIWFMVKHMREKRTWKNRERHWMYDKLFFGNGDQENGINAAVMYDLHQSARELLQRGCYIDYYGDYKKGATRIYATPLYAAVDFGKPEFVELLIRGGADRSLRSSAGMTPEQLLKKKLERVNGGRKNGGQEKQEKKREEGKTEETEFAEKLEKIERIFEKYDKKKFRPRIYDSMPIEKFNISVRAGAKNETNFEAKFCQMLSVGAPNIASTHYVCKVDENGVVDVENLCPRNITSPSDIEKVSFVLMDLAILVKESWLDACMENKKNLYRDHEYRINKVRYNGKVYDTVKEWQKWNYGWAVPCLFNVRVAFVLKGEDDASKVQNLSRTNVRIGELLIALSAEQMILKDLIDGSSTRNEQRPYWFPELNCHWVLYPAAEKANFDAVWEETKKQCDKVDQATPFVIMTFEEFFDKLLSLNGYKDLLAAKYPKNGGEPKKDAPPESKDETATEGSNEKTKTGSAEPSSRGSSLTLGSAEGSGTKSTTPKSSKSPKL